MFTRYWDDVTARQLDKVMQLWTWPKKARPWYQWFVLSFVNSDDSLAWSGDCWKLALPCPSIPIRGVLKRGDRHGHPALMYYCIKTQISFQHHENRLRHMNWWNVIRSLPELSDNSVYYVESWKKSSKTMWGVNDVKCDVKRCRSFTPRTDISPAVPDHYSLQENCSNSVTSRLFVTGVLTVVFVCEEPWTADLWCGDATPNQTKVNNPASFSGLSDEQRSVTSAHVSVSP